MLRSFALAVILTSASLLAGCAHEAATVAAIPAPVIDDATYDLSNHDYVIIKGGYFKTPSTSNLDVVATVDGRYWKPATKIIESSGLAYRVALPYGRGYSQVWVRVFGVNGEYSAPALMH